MGLFARLKSNPYAWSALQALTWVPVMIFIVDHGLSIASIDGRSMQPTLNPDSNKLKRDIVLLNKWSAMRHDFERGQVVTLTSPSNPNSLLIKRIIAVQGDTVRPLRAPDKPVVVPRGHCWVEGDEAFHSKDSNTFGTVPMALVTAKVTRILWPPARFGLIAVKPVGPNRVTEGAMSLSRDDDLW